LIIFPDWRNASRHSYERNLLATHNIEVAVWALVCHFYLNCCVCCGKYLRFYYNLSIDHIDSDWTNNDVRNFQPLCRRCNTSKGKTLVDYRWDKGQILARWLPLMHDKVASLEYINAGGWSLLDIEKMAMKPPGISAIPENGRHHSNGKATQLPLMELLT
jgi:hypothetical protein